MRYRFHGRFISETRARQIGNLKGASRYLTSEFQKTKIEGYKSEKSFVREQELARQIRARSEAARRGWETRRAETRARSEAARRGWETRRAREEFLLRESKKAIREIEREAREAREEAEGIPDGFYVDEKTGELYREEDIPEGAEVDEDTREVFLPIREEEAEEVEEFEGEFSGWDYEISDFDDGWFVDGAMADIEDEDKYEQAD